MDDEINCKVCDGGPNGHTLSCPALGVVKPLDLEAVAVGTMAVLPASADPQERDDVIARLLGEIERLQSELNEADRRAGAAERMQADLVKERSNRKQWLARAKDSRGFTDWISFDRVWDDMVARVDDAEEVIKRISEATAFNTNSATLDDAFGWFKTVSDCYIDRQADRAKSLEGWRK